MKTFTTQRRQPQANIQPEAASSTPAAFNFNITFPKVAAVVAGAATATAAFAYGMPAFYLAAGSSLAGAYMLYPTQIENWFTAHQGPLLGASIGFLHSGPVGMAVGGWLGYFVSEKIKKAAHAAQQVVETVRPVATPFHIASQTLRGAWRGVKNGLGATSNWLFASGAQPEMQAPDIENTRQIVPTSQAVVHRVRFNLANQFINNTWQGFKDSYKTATNWLFTSVPLENENAGQIVRAPSRIQSPGILRAIMPNNDEQALVARSSNAVAMLEHRNEERALIRRNEQIRSSSVVQAAEDFFDLMHGNASDEAYERHDGNWATRDVFDLAGDAFASVKSNVSWLWQKARGTSTSAAEPVVSAAETQRAEIAEQSPRP